MSPPACATPLPMQIRYLIFPAGAGIGSVVEPETAELTGVALPVLGDLDTQVEVDPGAEERLDLAAGPAAHVLQPRSPRADDDGLLAGPLHVELGVHVGEVVAAGPRPHLLDHHGDRVRQLVPDPVQGGLPDQ